MPIYEYQCERCGTVTDIKHGFKEPMNDTCPKCAGALKRLFNPASIVFKGSGFYVNDSRKTAGANAKADGSNDSSSSESSKSEPSKSEPSKSEPSKAEPSKSDAPKNESSKGSAGKSGSEAAA